MESDPGPISVARIAVLGIVAAVAATVAALGLIFSDQGDDAARASYLVALAACVLVATLLPALLQRRQSEITELRGDAAVLIFQLRAHAVELAQSSNWPRERLAASLREATSLAAKARTISARLVRAGVGQEAVELRVAVEAVEAALRRGGDQP